MVAALRPGPGLVSVDVELLSDEQITAALAGLPGWSRSGDSITTTVELEDFRAAMLYTGAVAYLADTANHHPDVLIQWNKVTLTLSTHSAGGLTGNDTALAERINALR
jgi:4a-hydroxytetrahydrobiopterin dehydratase